jgi:hypothetical protein
MQLLAAALSVGMMAGWLIGIEALVRRDRRDL